MIVILAFVAQNHEARQTPRKKSQRYPKSTYNYDDGDDDDDQPASLANSSYVTTN